MRKNKILGLVKKYIESQEDRFSAGETYVRTSGASWDAEDVASLVELALDRWYTDGKYGYEFERFMAQILKQRHVTLCNSGSSANLLAMSALMSKQLKGRELRKGDEVITVAAGFPTTVNPIIQNGLVPVFVDTSLPTYNALPHAIEEAISDKTRAIFIAHTLGNPYQAQRVRDLADRSKLWVISDCCFVSGTKIKTNKGDVCIEDIKAGDWVLTRKGYRKVTANEMTGKKSVISNMGLTGTPDHPVITKDGIKRLDALSASDIIYVCNQNQSFITELSIQDAQTLLGVTCEYITGEDRQQEEPLFTGRYIQMPMERYQGDSTFITLTEIPSITNYPILSLSHGDNTQISTSLKAAEKMLPRKTLNSQGKRLLNGIEVGRDTIYTSELEKTLGKTKRLILQLVRCVEKNIKRIFRADQKTAQRHVKTEAEVYNLCVEGEHEYFANNILVHNCDALGSEYEGKPLPWYADISTFSFYPAHHISMGEGGAVSTDSPLLNKIIRAFRDWGRDCWCLPGKDNTCGKRFCWQLGDLPYAFDHKYTYSEVGYNLKATDLQASLGVTQIKKLPQFVQARRETWSFYRKELDDLGEFFILPEPTVHSNPSWFGFTLTVREEAPFGREELVNYLESNKVGTRMLFGGNLTRQPAYKDVNFRVSGSLKKSDIVMNQSFWIGVAPIITPPMRSYVVEKIHEFINEKLRTN